MKIRIFAALLLIASVFIGYGVYASNTLGQGFLSKFPFKLGLDLNGGTNLVYSADTSKIAPVDVRETMNALRDVIEKRVNLFGVSEPVVEVEQSGSGASAQNRLIVELPGVTDVTEAVRQIGKTPLLDFRVTKPSAGSIAAATSSTSTINDQFVQTGLTGQFVTRAQIQFENNTNEPVVSLTFNDQGKALFDKITKENVGKVVGIFLDNQPISLPVVHQEIPDGKAQISGNFTIPEAQELVRNLNYGALPVPVALISTETVGPTLGKAVLDAGVHAGVIAFIVIALFLIFWYRLPGLVAVVALGIYTVLNLAIFKLIPVTLTAAGIAGFILSLGIAVDANILIFERTKEELRKGKILDRAIHEGFARAWNSIRDSNTSSIITALILYYFAATSVVKGFALVFLIGVLVSMFTAITATRAMLYALPHRDTKFWRFLFGTGLTNSTNSSNN